MSAKERLSAKDVLIKFMWRKNEILKEHGAPIDYFTESDANAIRRWSDAEAMVALSITEADMDDTAMCPFCNHHLNDSCRICEYGKHHGICRYGGDYHKLTKWVKEEKRNAYIGRLWFILIDYQDELTEILKEGMPDEEKTNTI